MTDKIRADSVRRTPLESERRDAGEDTEEKTTYVYTGNLAKK